MKVDAIVDIHITKEEFIVMIQTLRQIRNTLGIDMSDITMFKWQEGEERCFVEYNGKPKSHFKEINCTAKSGDIIL